MSPYPPDRWLIEVAQALNLPPNTLYEYADIEIVARALEEPYRTSGGARVNQEPHEWAAAIWAYLIRHPALGPALSAPLAAHTARSFLRAQGYELRTGTGAGRARLHRALRTVRATASGTTRLSEAIRPLLRKSRLSRGPEPIEQLVIFVGWPVRQGRGEVNNNTADLEEALSSIHRIANEEASKVGVAVELACPSLFRGLTAHQVWQASSTGLWREAVGVVLLSGPTVSSGLAAETVANRRAPKLLITEECSKLLEGAQEELNLCVISNAEGNIEHEVRAYIEESLESMRALSRQRRLNYFVNFRAARRGIRAVQGLSDSQLQDGIHDAGIQPARFVRLLQDPWTLEHAEQGEIRALTKVLDLTERELFGPKRIQGLSEIEEDAFKQFLREQEMAGTAIAAWRAVALRELAERKKAQLLARHEFVDLRAWNELMTELPYEA